MAETNIDTEIDTDVSQTALKVPLGGPHPKIDDTFTVILPTEENGIPSFIASIPKTLARSASNMILNYARRFGLSITKHKYFLIFLSAVTGVSLAYSLTGRSKRHIIIPIADQMDKPDIGTIQQVLTGVKDFAKVVSNSVPMLEAKMKKVLNKHKLKSDDLFRIIFFLEKIAFQNLLKKKLNSNITFDMMIDNTNNAYQWGLSDQVFQQLSHNRSILELLAQTKPQVPQSQSLMVKTIMSISCILFLKTIQRDLVHAKMDKSTTNSRFVYLYRQFKVPELINQLLFAST